MQSTQYLELFFAQVTISPDYIYQRIYQAELPTSQEPQSFECALNLHFHFYTCQRPRYTSIYKNHSFCKDTRLKLCNTGDNIKSNLFITTTFQNRNCCVFIKVFVTLVMSYTYLHLNKAIHSSSLIHVKNLFALRLEQVYLGTLVR